SLGGVRRRVIYKRFGVKSGIVPWLSLLRPPPALRSWVHGHGLRERCLPTVRPLAVLHRTRQGLLCEGYLLSLKVEDAEELPRFLDGLLQLPVAERRTLLRERIDQAARLIRELHHREVSHRDLKGANILTTRIGCSAPLLQGLDAGVPNQALARSASSTAGAVVIHLVGRSLAPPLPLPPPFPSP